MHTHLLTDCSRPATTEEICDHWGMTPQELADALGRIVTSVEVCEECGGDGGGEGSCCHFNPANGDAWGDWIECRACSGKGEFVTETYPTPKERPQEPEIIF